MEQNVQEKEGISLLDILRLLWSKVLILLLTVIVGGLAGAGVAIVRTINVDYWGTRVEFYVNPDKPKQTTGEGSQYGVYGAYGRHVMDNMVKLLDSESFTEKLMLNGADLPVAEYWINPNNPSEVALGLDVKVATAQEALILSSALKNVTEKQAKVVSEDFMNLQNAWATAIIGTEYAQSTTYNKNLYSQAIHDFRLAGIDTTDLEAAYISYEGSLDSKTASSTAQTLLEPFTNAAEEALPSFRSDFDAAKKLTNEKDKAIAINAAYEKYFNSVISVFDSHKKALGSNVILNTISSAASTAKEVAEAEKTAAYETWSHTEAYKSELAKYSSAVSFSYLRADEDTEDANNLARSFIYVKISVLNDREFANELLESVKNVVPGYVEENMAKPADYEGTNCQRITRSDEIRLTNPGYTTTEAIKYGLLFAAAALVIACVIIIIVDKSDKRLRDYEIITKKFNVPVLGVVPTIETLTEESNAKAKQNAKKNKEAK
ncbi:MAG: hypothetical protein IKA20_02460 [Clostridia bacterium]|nr:hypothetical protein [Clostridia bacterium]